MADLIAYLDAGNARCVHCDYDLRGSILADRTACPECGQPIRLTVAAASGYLSWLTMLVVSAMLMGGSTLYLTYVYRHDLQMLLEAREVAAMWIAAAVSGSVLCVLLARRERITRRASPIFLVGTIVYVASVAVFLIWWLQIFSIANLIR